MVKSPATYDQQLAKLIEHGCIVEDPQYAQEVLSRVGYYRFLAYFLPFTGADKRYAPNTKFETVYRIYEFDRKLRQLLFSAVEEVEINLWSQLSYFHAHKYGSLGYMDAVNFNAKHNHARFMEAVKREIDNNKQVLFVRHHMQKYNGEFPLWVVTELFTFGMLSYFFSDLQIQDQKLLAKELYSTTYTNVTSWLRCCTDLRNICAHYGRLYYRVFSAIPANIPSSDPKAARRLYTSLLALKELYPDRAKWVSHIVIPLRALIEEYQEDITLWHIGFPTNWENQLSSF